MRAKSKKHDVDVEQQGDLINNDHKNINKIHDIFYDQQIDRHVIVSDNYHKTFN